MIIRFGICFILALAAAGSFAAEPEVDSKQLPRVPPTEPGNALATFRIKPGFRLQLAAAEPLVVSPVAMSFDEEGRLYVIEMRDYSERRPERLGRVRLLEDVDGDGRFEKSTVFAEDLPWPTAVIGWAGGVFVGATPDILYFKDTDGDGKADVREIIFSGFGSDYAPFATNKLNVQALMNSFNWSLDNRIHGATSFSGGKVKLVDTPFTRRWLEQAGGNPQAAFRNASSLDLRGRDFSFDPRTLSLRPESGGGQHGMSFDDRGRKYVCSNSDHIQWILYEDRFAARFPDAVLPSPRVSIAADGPAAEVYRMSPEEPWRVIRTQWRVSGLVPGPIEGGGRSSGYFTGATGVTIYRGDVFGEEFVGDAFIGDAGSNLVHRKKLRPDGLLLRAERPADEQKVEFLASTDNWVRPVQFANAPDGCLYIADMYREVIEHPWSLPANLKKQLDLNSGNDRGRIYRVVPENFSPRPPTHLRMATSEDLVKVLEHPNGWHRDTAARLLYERQDRTVLPKLAELISPPSKGFTVIRALHALAGLQGLTEEKVRYGMAHTNGAVRENALKLAEPFLARPSEALWTALRRLVEGGVLDQAEAPCDVQLAFALAATEGPQRTELLLELLQKPTPASSTVPTSIQQSRWMESFILSVLRTDAYDLFADLAGGKRPIENSRRLPLLVQLARAIGVRHDSKQIAKVLEFAVGHDLATGRVEGVGRDPLLASEIVTALDEGLRQSGTTLQATASGTSLPRIYDSIRPIALGRSQGVSDPTRAATIRALATAPYPDVKTNLLNLLFVGTNPPAIQRVTVEMLGKFSASSVGDDLLAGWALLTPGVRTEVVSVLLKRPEQIRALLAALAKGTVQAADLSIAQKAQLRSHRDATIREQASTVLGRATTTTRQSVVEAFQSALSLPGNTANGHKIFQARCAPCHRLGNEGSLLGPDLATVKSGGKEKLLIAILDPNREVAPNFASYTMETKDGESLTGVLALENASSVTLRMAGGVENVIARKNITSLQSQGRSLMPEGLEEGLQSQDLADLLDFLLAR